MNELRGKGVVSRVSVKKHLNLLKKSTSVGLLLAKYGRALKIQTKTEIPKTHRRTSNALHIGVDNKTLNNCHLLSKRTTQSDVSLQKTIRRFPYYYTSKATSRYAQVDLSIVNVESQFLGRTLHKRSQIRSNALNRALRHPSAYKVLSSPIQMSRNTVLPVSRSSNKTSLPIPSSERSVILKKPASSIGSYSLFPKPLRNHLTKHIQPNTTKSNSETQLDSSYELNILHSYLSEINEF